MPKDLGRGVRSIKQRASISASIKTGAGADAGETFREDGAGVDGTGGADGGQNGEDDEFAEEHSP
jgi:hypothetical protein